MLLPVDLLMSLSSAVQQREGSAVSAQPSTGVSRTTAAFSWDDEGGDPRALLDSLLASLDEQQGVGFAEEFVTNLRVLLPITHASGAAQDPDLASTLLSAAETSNVAPWTADELIGMAQQWISAGAPATQVRQALNSEGSGNVSGKQLPADGQSVTSEVLASALAALFQPQSRSQAIDATDSGIHSPVARTDGVQQRVESVQANEVLQRLMHTLGALPAMFQARTDGQSSVDPIGLGSAADPQLQVSGGVLDVTANAPRMGDESTVLVTDALLPVSQGTQRSDGAAGEGQPPSDIRTPGRPASISADSAQMSSLSWRSLTGSDISAASAQVGGVAQTPGGQSAAAVGDFVLSASLPGQIDAADDGKTSRQSAVPDFSSTSYGGDVRREQAMQARESFVMPENWQRAGLQWQTQAMNAFGQPQWGEGIGRQLLIMSANGIQSAQIRLDPPELGTLMVKVKMSGEVATVNFVSQHAMVRDMLDTQLPRLQDMFREQGLELANASVSDNGSQGSGSGAGESDGEAGRQGKHSERDPMPDEQPMPLARASSLIDYYA